MESEGGGHHQRPKQPGKATQVAWKHTKASVSSKGGDKLKSKSLDLREKEKDKI